MKRKKDQKKRVRIKVIFGVAVITIFCFLMGLYYFNIIPHKAYSNADFGIEIYKSSFDQDQDLVDDQTDILNSAREYIATKPKYKSKYYAETGYPTDGYGVCTDVVAFALRDAGYDLQELVNQDILENNVDYNVEEVDKNIDFRRVRNLLVYFEHHAISLTTDLSEIEQWQGGDIVIMKGHIGIVSDKRNKKGIPFLIHHANPFQISYEEDVLGTLYNVIGHYRIGETVQFSEKAENFAKEVKQQILTFDWEGLSENILYPIQIGNTTYFSKEEFMAEEFTFSDEFRKKLEEESCEGIIESEQGIGLEETKQVCINDFFVFELSLSAAEPKVLEINGLWNQKTVEVQQTALSMEQVVALANQPKDFLLLNEELRKYWIHNVENDFDKNIIAYSTVYSVWHKEEEYLFEIVYQKKRAEIERVCLRRVSDGEEIFLYDAENAYRQIHLANGEEVLSYLEEHRQMSDYFTVQLPENFIIAPYDARIGYGGGSCLISNNTADNIYLEELMVYANLEELPLSIEWYSIGGMCCYCDCVDWEEDKISHISIDSIHRMPAESGENLEKCEVPAYLEMVGLDLFTMVSLEEAEKKYGEISPEKQMVRQWYVYFAKPDSRDVYVIWLNADLYSREEVIQFAESIHFTERAFQNKI